MGTSPFDKCIKIRFNASEVVKERLQTSRTNHTSILHTVKPGETIQGIAFKYYGDSGKWGDIADVNNIYFPFEELDEGQQIVIP